MRHPWSAIARLLPSGRRRMALPGRRGVMGFAFAAASLVAIPSVHALLIVPQFYDGLWNCTLDGRDVRIS